MVSLFAVHVCAFTAAMRMRKYEVVQERKAVLQGATDAHGRISRVLVLLVRRYFHHFLSSHATAMIGSM